MKEKNLDVDSMLQRIGDGGLVSDQGPVDRKLRDEKIPDWLQSLGVDVSNMLKHECSLHGQSNSLNAMIRGLDDAMSAVQAEVTARVEASLTADERKEVEPVLGQGIEGADRALLSRLAYVTGFLFHPGETDRSGNVYGPFKSFLESESEKYHVYLEVGGERKRVDNVSAFGICNQRGARFDSAAENFVSMAMLVISGALEKFYGYLSDQSGGQVNKSLIKFYKLALVDNKTYLLPGILGGAAMTAFLMRPWSHARVTMDNALDMPELIESILRNLSFLTDDAPKDEFIPKFLQGKHVIVPGKFRTRRNEEPHAEHTRQDLQEAAILAASPAERERAALYVWSAAVAVSAYIRETKVEYLPGGEMHDRAIGADETTIAAGRSTSGETCREYA